MGVPGQKCEGGDWGMGRGKRAYGDYGYGGNQEKGNHWVCKQRI